MENKNIKPGQKRLIQDFNALAWVKVIFGVIIILLALSQKDSTYQMTFFLISIIHFLTAFLMFKAKKYAIEGSQTAHTYGIITGILLILALDLIDIILGIIVLVDSSNYNRAING